MESFFLAETTKYLYLLFDTDNFIHNQGEHGTIIDTPNGECIIEAGGYVFNTEAHPIDPSALYCCHEVPNQRLFDFDELKSNGNRFQGDSIKDVKNSKEQILEDVTPTVITNNIDQDNESQIEIGVTEANENYKLDAADSLFSKSSVESSSDAEGNLTEKGGDGHTNAKLYHAIKNMIPPNKKQPFNPQKMLERFRIENKYPVNSSWVDNYEVLSCKAQPFLQKMSLYGEFFNK